MRHPGYSTGFCTYRNAAPPRDSKSTCNSAALKRFFTVIGEYPTATPAKPAHCHGSQQASSSDWASDRSLPIRAKQDDPADAPAWRKARNKRHGQKHFIPTTLPQVMLPPPRLRHANTRQQPAFSRYHGSATFLSPVFFSIQSNIEVRPHFETKRSLRFFPP
jgi:hypothetical protein